jgi:hypothetical protein
VYTAVERTGTIAPRGGPRDPIDWWTQRGSKRWLNDPESLEETIRYVLDCQGDPTPHPPQT